MLRALTIYSHGSRKEGYISVTKIDDTVRQPPMPDEPDLKIVIICSSPIAAHVLHLQE